MLPAHLRLIAEEHINALAERHKIYVRRNKKWDTSEADMITMMIMVPTKIRTGIDYLATLHEMGHLVDPIAREHETRRLRSKGKGKNHKDAEVLLVEAAAWAWAIRNARKSVLKGFTKADWRKVGMCWASWAGPVW